MDDKELEPEINYLKGFNEGYIIAKYSPNLSKKLETIDYKDDRLQGIKDGFAQYSFEKNKDKQPNWLNRDFSGNRSPERNADKGAIEPSKE